MSHFNGFNRPYFGHHNMQQENGHIQYRKNLPTANRRPHYHNENAHFYGHQERFDNSEKYWCETCDRDFRTLQQLESHKLQHQTCNIDGCKFVAHPKIITKHIQMQHSSGIYKRIAKLDNPEEVKKWIEERKKKYPTKENIEKKSAEIKEKIVRGEKMGLRQDRFQRNNLYSGVGVKRKTFAGNSDNQQIKRPMRQNKFEKKPHFKVRSAKEVQLKKVNSVAPVDETRKLRPFTGIQNINMGSDSNDEVEQLNCNFLIDDDDCELSHKTEKTITNEPAVCGALTSLMCNYGSSDEDNDDVKEDPSEQNHNKDNLTVNKSIETKIGINIEIPKIIEENKSDDDSGPEETNVGKEGDIIRNEIIINKKIAEKQIAKKTNNICNNRKHTFIRPKPRVPSTLLHKLLQREVQHERNVVLQCVRYIVSNNYFGK